MACDEKFAMNWPKFMFVSIFFYFKPMIPNVFQCTCMSDWARVKNVFVDTKTGLNGLNYVFYLFFMIKM